MKNKKRLNRKDISRLISKRTGYSIVNIEEILKELPEVIKIALLNGHEIDFINLGKFVIRKSKSKRTISPIPEKAKRGEWIEIPERDYPAFKIAYNIKNGFRPISSRQNTCTESQTLMFYNPDGWKYEYYEEDVEE